MEKKYQNFKVIILEQNYRSTNTILEAANSVIKNNLTRKEKKLWSDNGKGVKIKYLRSYDAKHEITLIISEIKSLLVEGYNYKDIAVLYRANALARTAEEMFLGSSIPYKVVGSYYFYNRKEIKDLISYLRLINNQHDEISLRRIINVPKRAIGLAAISNLEKKSIDDGVSMFDALSTSKELEFKKLINSLQEKAKDLSLTELVDEVLEKTGLLHELKETKSLESDIKIENLMEFKSITYAYENETGNINLGDFLESVSLVSDISSHKSDGNEITLMTLRSAKGLEFPIVFIIGMEEGIFPSFKVFQSNEELEEERRLCYVGITRAKERLYLTNTKRRLLYGKEQNNPPSRFISEIEDDLIESKGILVEAALPQIQKSNMYTDEEVNYDIGDIVKHDIFGNGIIIGKDERFLTIKFKAGVKKLAKNHKSIKKV